MHTISNRWRLGLALAATAAAMWSVLPIALKPLLASLDPYTITWFRMTVAAVVLGLYQARRGTLPQRRALAGGGVRLIVFASMCLAANYLLYLMGLQYITPEAAQVTIQLAPMLMLLGGLVFFRERFSAKQWLGFVVLAAGLVLFFNHRLAEIAAARGSYPIGLALIIAAACSWAAYALAQKKLLARMSSSNILLLIYCGGSLVFLPISNLPAMLQLSALDWSLLAFGSINTLIAYGAFAEALEHWEATRVSAVLACTPLLTLGAMFVVGAATSLVAPEPINALSIAGALMVVAGSMVTALSGRRAHVPASAPAT